MITEIEICRQMKEFMLARGWAVLEEVPMPRRGRRIDLVGMQSGRMFGVEAKRSFNIDLRLQVQGLGQYCDLVAAVTATAPSHHNLRFADAWGVGVYTATDGGIVEVLAPNPKARLAQTPVAVYRRWLYDWCIVPGRPASVSAGSKMGAGCGMAQQLIPAVRAFFAENPSADWRVAFVRVPNHYASAASMRAALRDRL